MGHARLVRDAGCALGFAQSLWHSQIQPLCAQVLELPRAAERLGRQHAEFERQFVQAFFDLVIARGLNSVPGAGLDHAGIRHDRQEKSLAERSTGADTDGRFRGQAAALKIREGQQEKARDVRQLLAVWGQPDSLPVSLDQFAAEQRFNFSIADERWERTRTVGELFELEAELLQRPRRH